MVKLYDWRWPDTSPISALPPDIVVTRLSRQHMGEANGYGISLAVERMIPATATEAPYFLDAWGHGMTLDEALSAALTNLARDFETKRERRATHAAEKAAHEKTKAAKFAALDNLFASIKDL